MCAGNGVLSGKSATMDLNEALKYAAAIRNYLMSISFGSYTFNVKITLVQQE
jgi:hypothetical protein